MVVIGFLGTVLDAGPKGNQRWQKWRPSVSLCQHEDMVIDRFELLIDSRHQRLADQIAADIRQVSPETEVRFHTIDLADPWDFEEVYSALHDFAARYTFAPEREDYYVHLTTGTHVAQICMFLLTEARYFPARLLQSSPPEKKTASPGRYSVIDLDLSRYDRIAQRFRVAQEQATSFLKSGIQTHSRNFNDIIDQIEKVAVKSRAPILLMGPTGAGKSHLAGRIYGLKKMRHQISGPFVEVNCATLKGDSAMSTLFGHKRGAFTGAVNARPGLLASADKGVLFLDEIAELGLDEQAMMLRAIEEKRFMPVGSDTEVASDFQLIAGTNKNLAEEVIRGNFREDLMARLDLWTYRLPGLRDRREDIEPNIDYELRKFARENSANITFNKEARAAYLKFCLSGDAIWSANFRDLSASITRMATLADGGRIRIGDVDREIQRLKSSWHAGHADQMLRTLNTVLSPQEIGALDLFDQVQLAAVIDICRNEASLSAAGRRLYAHSRAQKKVTNDADRLSKYLARYGLKWGDIHAAGKRGCRAG